MYCEARIYLALVLILVLIPASKKPSSCHILGRRQKLEAERRAARQATGRSSAQKARLGLKQQRQKLEAPIRQWYTKVYCAQVAPETLPTLPTPAQLSTFESVRHFIDVDAHSTFDTAGWEATVGDVEREIRSRTLEMRVALLNMVASTDRSSPWSLPTRNSLLSLFPSCQ